MVSRLDKILLLLGSMQDHLSAHGNAFVKSPSWHRSSPSGFGAVQKEVCPTCKGARRTVHATEPCHKCLIGDDSQSHGCGHCQQCYDAKKKRSRGYVFVDPMDFNREPVLSEPEATAPYGASVRSEQGRGDGAPLPTPASGSESIRQLDKADFPANLTGSDLVRFVPCEPDTRFTIVAPDMDAEGCVRCGERFTNATLAGAAYGADLCPERGLTGSEADGKPQETAKQLARSRRVDKEIALLLSKPVGPEVWERERATRDRRGSYRELERALEALRMESPLHSSLILRVYVNHDVELEHVDAMGQWHLHYALTWLSDNMPASINVPQELLERDETSKTTATVHDLAKLGWKSSRIARELGWPQDKVKRALKRAA